MATLKQRLTRLEELIGELPSPGCPSCHGLGHPRRSVIPWMGGGTVHSHWEEIPVLDTRLDADGCCMICGTRSVLAPVVELAAPPELEHKHLRLLD